MSELYEHHDLALKELQSFIQLAEVNDNINGKVQILACIVQFISFELFRGGASIAWELHLQAGASLAPELTTHMPLISNNLTTTLDATATAISFMCGVILWFDILSTITTGKKTLLHAHREVILAVIHIDNITGCRNWVVSRIDEISDLAARQSVEIITDQEFWEINAQAQQIMERLKTGLQTTKVEGDALKEHNSVRSAADFTCFIACISTQVYAAAALVFVQVTIFRGYLNSTDLRSYVSQTISALKDIPEPQMTRSFIWPLVIAGCMASEAEYAFFESKFLQIGKAGLAFGNSSQSLALLRKCWQLRSTSDSQALSVDWRHAMSALQVRVLCV